MNEEQAKELLESLKSIAWQLNAIAAALQTMNARSK